MESRKEGREGPKVELREVYKTAFMSSTLLERDLALKKKCY